jgi:Family of unknown function (DUF6338)
MMASVPTTLSGLVLFVVLLLPGFAYVVGKERHTTGQQLSAFRETAAVVAASVTFELIVIGLFAILRTLLPAQTPDIGALIRQSGNYIRGHGHQAGHYGQVAIWAAGMLALAVVLAYGATLPSVRKLASKVTGSYPHESSVSGWWKLFDDWQAGRDIRVKCNLDDGSYVEGDLGSYSTVGDDKPDRDLILIGTINYRPPGDDQLHAYGASAVCLSAARIVTMFIVYSEDGTPPTPASPRWSLLRWWRRPWIWLRRWGRRGLGLLPFIDL